MNPEMAATDTEDSEIWSATAFRYAELAAHQIARFRNPHWNPTWQDLIPVDDRPSFSIRWGLRGKRSRQATNRTGFEKRDGGSPATPLDFGSGFASRSGSGVSTSGGDERSISPEKRRRVGDDDADVTRAGGGCETQVVQKGRAPLVGRASEAKDIRRPGKKKTLCELQQEERLLLEEKNMLQKEVERGRKAYEDLKAENQRLKNQLLLQSNMRPSINASTTASSSAPPSSDAHFLIPDLNEPLSEN